MATMFDEALAAEGITGPLAALARSVFQQETTSGSNVAVSSAGARGPMQVMKGTFNEVADKGWDIDDPLHNMRAGLRYLGARYKQANGDPALAAAGYYGGPGGLEKARKGIAVSDPTNPNAPNTLEYGQQVASRVTGKKGATRAPIPVAPPVESPGLPVAVEAPVVAQAQPVVAPAPVAVAAPVQMGPDPWNEFNRAYAAQNQLAAAPPKLDYGPQINDEMNRQFQLAQINTMPDFRKFGAWGVKA